MRWLFSIALFLLIHFPPRLPAEEPIFAPRAKLKIEADNGSGGEGPAWDPPLGLLSSGNGHTYVLDRDGNVARDGLGVPDRPLGVLAARALRLVFL